MAEKAPLSGAPSADIAAKSGDQGLRAKYNSVEYDDTQAVKERGRKRLKWLALLLLVLAVVGGAVGLGVGLSTRDKDHKKATKSTPVASPSSQNASDITVDQLRFLPDARSQAKALLANTSTEEARSALQQLEDVENLTPEVVIKFLDYFNKKANLTAKGIDIDYLKSQAYSVVRWLRARPQLNDVLTMLRKWAKNPNFNAVELAQAVDQLIGNLKISDFQKFLARKTNDSHTFNQTQLGGMVELSEEEELGGLDTTGTPTGRRSLLANFAQYLDPINQAVFKTIPNSFINNPKNAGLKGFKRVTVPVIFHVTQYFDPRGYTYPYNAYSQGSKPGQVLIEQMNRAYAAANIKFVLKEWRNNPKIYKYLKIGTLQAWQVCASEAETCTCSLAEKYNVNPTKVANIWVIGSDNLQYADLPDIAYSTIIPGVMDSCKDVMNWGVPSSKSRHLWLTWDMVDPDGQNSAYAYQFGAMTLIHEMGHYLGLLHTHEGDCQDLDKVRDTPANLVIQDQGFNYDLQKWCISSYGKKLTGSQALHKTLQEFDSCKNKPYIDNFGNFMSYVHSSCYRLFTVGQIRRMQKTIMTWHKNFRA